MQVIEKSHLAIQQCLCFRLAGSDYAVDVASVQELRGREQSTACPDAPAFVRGVINIRGMVVPVVDLRRCFALPDQADALTTAMIVINLLGEDIVLALVVDAVSELCAIASHQVQTAGNQSSLIAKGFVHESLNRFVKGLVKQGEQTIAVLDIHAFIHQGLLSYQTEIGSEQQAELVCA